MTKARPAYPITLVFPLYGGAKKRLNELMGSQWQPSDNEQAEASGPAARRSMSAAVTWDDLLVAVGKSRNRDAFVRLFEYFAPRVKSFLMRGAMSADQADELAQETMLTVWHKAGSFDPQKARASTWIFTIARNKKIDWLRKSRPEPMPDDPVTVKEEDRPLPDELLNRTQEAEAIAGAMKDLPPEQAEIIKMAFFEDKTHSEIARETDLPLGTVKSRIRLALDRLHYNLNKDGLGKAGLRKSEGRGDL